MRLTVYIDTDNDMFHPDAGPEVARILTELANEYATVGLPTKTETFIKDLNGNNVGRISEGTIARLRLAHRDGAGIIIFLGDRADLVGDLRDGIRHLAKPLVGKLEDFSKRHGFCDFSTTSGRAYQCIQTW